MPHPLPFFFFLFIKLKSYSSSCEIGDFAEAHVCKKSRVWCFDRAYCEFDMAYLCKEHSPYVRETKSEAAEFKEWRCQ